VRIRILGSAAGGGVPQWNCACFNCEAARTGSLDVRPRTQSSVAVSADGCAWILLNVSPDVRRQIISFPPLGPAAGAVRGQSIVGCILTDAELDHTAGLLFLREGGPFTIYSTVLVRRWLNRFFPVEPLLARFMAPTWVEMPLDQPWLVPGTEDASPHLQVRAFELAPHRPRFVSDAESDLAGSVVGLLVQDIQTGGKLLYAPCVGALDESLASLAREADAILFDGTFWTNDEPQRLGLRTALEMGHVPIGGPRGSLAWLAHRPAPLRMYVHINNTNPVLNERGPEYRRVRERGVRVATDGDQFDL
jgi:pyrroloquinoline quinone biosynthesis protein B